MVLGEYFVTCHCCSQEDHLKDLFIPKAFLPISIGAFACVIGALSLGLSETSGRWPGIVALLLIGFCVLEVIFSRRKPTADSPSAGATDATQSGWKTLLLTFSAAMLASLFGLLVALAAFAVAHGTWIGRRSPLAATLTAAVSVLILFGFFELGLGVTLYRGIMF